MRTGRVIVYVKGDSADQLVSRIDRLSCKGWDTQIKIRPFKTGQRSTETIEQRLSEGRQEDNISKIFVDRSLKARCSELKGEGIKIRSLSLEAIYREICDELKNRRFHWLTHSMHEWQKSGIKHIHPQAWCEQFSDLGCDWVGEGLLKQIRVISDAELRSEILIPEMEQFGLQVAHGYVSDREPGSSSINIKDILEHSYTTPILEIDLAAEPPPLVDKLNVLYLYEDGLWSGVELVKRLALLAKWRPVRSRDLKVVFRYGATSDAGLLAGRNFVRREGLTTSIEISPATSNHFTMLRDNALNDALLQIGVAVDEEFRRSLDSRVLPYAFRVSNAWKGKADEAVDVCREIGSQLVRPWLQRMTKGEGVLENRVAKWSLGAFGFASMITFSKSVPKPVLPLLWLSGKVNIGGKNMDWKPLFWDARRTGFPPPAI